ncbi:MAG: XdhC family protein [Planctomycetota bacterium]|nr:XdhC family protein [Planctomycetota bacterium]
MQEIWSELQRLAELGSSCALCTIVSTQGSTPGKESMKMLVRADGSFVGTVGGGCLEAEVLEAALESMEDERPRRLAFALNERDYPDSGLVCGGRLEIFVDPQVEPHLFLFGGGHISAALASLAKGVGFHVTVFDDREAFATPDKHPDANEVRCLEFADAVAAAVEATGPGDDASTRYFVVCTRGHQDDELIVKLLHDALGGRPPKYLGMVGSRAKRATLWKSLAEAGVAKTFFEGVQSPMGLDIGAKTHEEIAVSVVGELIRVRRLGS